MTPTFVGAVQEHRSDTVLVNDSLINTFREVRDLETDPDKIAAYDEIIGNLETISYQSVILEKYVETSLTEDELIEVFRSKWRIRR